MNSANILVWTLGVVFVYSVSDRKETLAKALVLGAGLLALTAILQYVIVFPRMLETFKDGLYGQIIREQGGLPFASYLHQNMVGGYLAILFPVALQMGVKHRWIPGLAACPVILAALVLSASRISLGLTFVTLAVAMIFHMMRREGRHLAVIGAILLVAAILSGYLLHGAPMAQQKERGGATRVLEEKARGAVSQLSTINTRTDIWRNGLRAFVASPSFGYGAGCFEHGYKRCFDGATYTRVAHSSILKYAVETGLIGVVCFCWYLCCAVFGFLRRTGRGGGVPPGVLLASLWAFTFGLVDFSFDVAAHVVTFFLLTSMPLLHRGAREGGVPGDRPVAGGGVSGAGLPVLVAILLIASFLFTTRTDLSRKSLEGGAILEENGLVTDAFLAYDSAVRDMPLNNEGYVRVLQILIRSYGNERNETSRLRTMEGIGVYLKRIGEPRDRDSELFFAMARGCALLGMHDKAGRYFREALILYPSSVYYTIEAMAYHRARGDTGKALELAASFRPYLEKYRTPHDPRGVHIYRFRDLEADLELESGRPHRALAIAEENLKDARERAFAITSARAREYVSEEDLLRHLQERVLYLRTETPATR